MNRPKTINVLHIASGDLWAGAEVQLFTLAMSLKKLDGVDVNIILLNHGTLEQKLADNNINVTVFDESRLNSFKILLQLIKAIRKSKPDIVHTHRVKENILGSIAALINRTATLRTSHGAPEHKPTWQQTSKRLTLTIDWFCGRFLQKKIIAVSDDLSMILKAEYPSQKIEVVENGIDLPQDIADKNFTESDSANNTGAFRVGIACRLVPVKRVDIFIKTAAKLISTHPEHDFSFHIFGDGPLLSDLVALNKKLGTEKNVFFEGHCDNIRQHLTKLDTLLITSDHEGLPMILLEAMATKTPVIAHAVGGIPTVLKHGVCGVLISDHRPPSYAGAISHLAKDNSARMSYASKAYSRVTDFYSSDKNANDYLSIYKNIKHQ